MAISLKFTASFKHQTQPQPSLSSSACHSERTLVILSVAKDLFAHRARSFAYAQDGTRGQFVNKTIHLRLYMQYSDLKIIDN